MKQLDNHPAYQDNTNFEFLKTDVPTKKAKSIHSQQLAKT